MSADAYNVADLQRRIKHTQKMDAARQTADDQRAAMPAEAVVSEQFRQDVERVLSHLDEKGILITTYGKSWSFSVNDDLYYRLPYVLAYLEYAGVIWSSTVRGDGTYWRRVKRG